MNIKKFLLGVVCGFSISFILSMYNLYVNDLEWWVVMVMCASGLSYIVNRQDIKNIIKK